MATLGKILTWLLAIAALTVGVFVELKGCVSTSWRTPSEIWTYGMKGDDGRSMVLSFLPDDKLMVVYDDPSQARTEAVLAEVYGTYGSHYVGQLWRLSGPGMLLGLRWCDDDVSPVLVYVKTLKKYGVGSGDSTFGKVGASFHQELLFGPSRVKFLGMWFERIETDEALTGRVYSILAGEGQDPPAKANRDGQQ